MCIGEHNIKFHTESNTKSLTMHIPIWYTDLILKLKNWDFRAFIKKKWAKLIYLFIWVEELQRKISSLLQFIPQMAILVKTVPGHNSSLGASSTASQMSEQGGG